MPVTTNPLFKLFGQSPFTPLQAHMRIVVRCADQVPGLFEALCAGDSGKIETVKDQIFTLENEADDIKNELRAHLPDARNARVALFFQHAVDQVDQICRRVGA